jgi:hypothetical protein
MTTLLRHAMLLLFIGIPAGCTDARDNAGVLVERDSAGVRIVEVQPRQWPPPEVWDVADTPVVDIGVRDGDPAYQLFEVQGATRSVDGGIVIAEFGARLRYYDAQGRHIRTLERAGQGPGEAGAFSGLTPYRGDSLLLITERISSNRSLTRMLILAADGSYGRNVMAWYPGGAERSEAWAWVGNAGEGTQSTLADGSFAIMGANRIDFAPAVNGIIAGRAALMRLDAHGALVDTIAILRASTYEHRPLETRKWELLLDEADPAPVRAHGMQLYYTTGERFVVDVYDAAASAAGDVAAPRVRLARSYRVHAAPTPSTAATRETYITTLIEVFRDRGDAAGRAQYRDRLESLRSPDSLPAVQDLQVDAIGNVWLETYQPPGASARMRARQRGLQIRNRPRTMDCAGPGGPSVGNGVDADRSASPRDRRR